MDAALQAQFTIAALVCSVTALFFSLLAAFPGRWPSNRLATPAFGPSEESDQESH